jgi:hypothetical protein
MISAVNWTLLVGFHTWSLTWLQSDADWAEAISQASYSQAWLLAATSIWHYQPKKPHM